MIQYEVKTINAYKEVLHFIVLYFIVLYYKIYYINLAASYIYMFRRLVWSTTFRIK